MRETGLDESVHLRDQGQSLRDIAGQLLITQGAKKGKRPSPATVMRMLREHDQAAQTAEATALEPTA
ncbi:hypothetical protein AB0K48_01810 [Nonomuraea sp. NPDC055795]